jgi:peptide/nickel transport system substrate-binding protein
VPKAYYQQVGPDGFKQKPIGAGPYKFVRQVAGTEVELEAFTEYWRKTPNVKTLIFKSAPEEATRLAQVQTGEADFGAQVQGPLIDIVRNDPKLRLTTRLGAPFWLEMPGFEKPDSPFNKLQVRQAVSYALDRQALSEAEQAGLARPLGNWLPLGWPGAIEKPPLPHDLNKAKQLMAEAGFPDGFEVESLTPLPPYFSFAERVITQLRQIGIRTKLQQMERGAFDQKITQGPDAFKGFILNISAASGDAAARVRAYATCGGSSSRTCVPEIDERFKKYEASTNPQEREKLMNEIQDYMYDNLIFVPVFRQAYTNVVGPRVANEWEEIFGAIPQYSFLGPYEDVRLKD